LLKVHEYLLTYVAKAKKPAATGGKGASAAAAEGGGGEGAAAAADQPAAAVEAGAGAEAKAVADELEALLDWVWESYWPAGGPLNEDEREEVVERFEKWRRRRHGSTHVPFAAFARWFLQLERLFVYLRRHETGKDVVLIMDEEERYGELWADDDSDGPEKHAAAIEASLDHVVGAAAGDWEEVKEERGVTTAQHASAAAVAPAVKLATFPPLPIATVRPTRTVGVACDDDTVSMASLDIVRAPGPALAHDHEKKAAAQKKDWSGASGPRPLRRCPACAPYGECLDLDREWGEDAITWEEEDEEEVMALYAFYLPVDDDDRHAEECIDDEATQLDAVPRPPRREEKAADAEDGISYAPYDELKEEARRGRGQAAPARAARPTRPLPKQRPQVPPPPPPPSPPPSPPMLPADVAARGGAEFDNDYAYDEGDARSARVVPFVLLEL
jgi:hypothetical protein